jgi:phosphoesterase RecJ-like protein
MKLMNEALDRVIRDRLASAKKIVIISHIRPDGDAVGSLLGLGNALLSAGKEVQMILEDGMPEKYLGLKNGAKVKRQISGD